MQHKLYKHKTLQPRAPHILSRFRRAVTRLRHRRGHGVHSPYVYNIVRSVFMRGGDRYSVEGAALYTQLLGMGASKSTAAEIERLRHHCGFSTVGVDSAGDYELVICSESMPTDEIKLLTQQATKRGTTVVILTPQLNASREQMCERIVLQHHSTTIHRKKYLVIFNNHLPKQHFIL